MLKEVYYDSNHMYIAKLESGEFIIAYENGTAIDLNGRRYRLVSHLDENEEVITDGWEPIT